VSLGVVYVVLGPVEQDGLWGSGARACVRTEPAGL
jgi:hypothetical protein